MSIQTINPATGELLHKYTCIAPELILQKIELGHNAYQIWKKTDFNERKQLVVKLSKLLNEQKETLAILMAQEMGKPITAGVAEIEKCVWLCEHYAQHAAGYLAERRIQTEMQLAKVCYQPLGLILGIMPWNFPFWQVFRYVIPTIMAGNGALLKHAAITTGCGVKIEQLFQQANFPQHLLQQLIVDTKHIPKIIEHNAVAAITLTGSELAGSSVAAKAGECLKKTVLELGGCDPYIVLEDADLDLAAQCIITSRLNNSGQVCIAAKRVLVIESIAEKLIDKILHLLPTYQIGDPLDPACNFGPLARDDLRTNLQLQVEKSVKQGANLLCGGIIPKGKGFYYPPTLLSNVLPGMCAFEEELFGPVIAITAVQYESTAIEYANQTHFGLGAALFTRDLNKGERIATQEIAAGVCFVNAFVASDPRLPFGGIKRSGYGRELSQEGILEFVNIKTVAIK